MKHTKGISKWPLSFCRRFLGGPNRRVMVTGVQMRKMMGGILGGACRTFTQIEGPSLLTQGASIVIFPPKEVRPPVTTASARGATKGEEIITSPATRSARRMSVATVR